MKPAEVGVLLNVLIHIFQNDRQIHHRLLSPDPAHPRSSLQAQGKKKKKQAVFTAVWERQQLTLPRPPSTLGYSAGFRKTKNEQKSSKKKKKDAHYSHYPAAWWVSVCPSVLSVPQACRRAVAVRRHTASCFYLKNTRLFHWFSFSGEIQKLKSG